MPDRTFLRAVCLTSLLYTNDSQNAVLVTLVALGLTVVVLERISAQLQLWSTDTIFLDVGTRDCGWC